jgi:hypothetical protein
MPIERGSWKVVSGWPTLNQQLTRLVDVFTGSDRVANVAVSSTGALALTWPMTLVTVNTTAGNVTLTLPLPATVPGFRVEVKKVTAANTVTLTSSALIDGAATLAWTTQYQSYSVISDGGTWHVV